jgi:hypothetical protein
MEELRVEREMLTKTQQAIKAFQNGNLSRRNGIMFIFKEIVPCMLRMHNKNVHANHTITLFMMCKRAYHDLSLFAKQLAHGENILGKSEYFS